MTHGSRSSVPGATGTNERDPARAVQGLVQERGDLTREGCSAPRVARSASGHVLVPAGIGEVGISESVVSTHATARIKKPNTGGLRARRSDPAGRGLGRRMGSPGPGPRAGDAPWGRRRRPEARPKGHSVLGDLQLREGRKIIHQLQGVLSEDANLPVYQLSILVLVCPRRVLRLRNFSITGDSGPAGPGAGPGSGALLVCRGTLSRRAGARDVTVGQGH